MQHNAFHVVLAICLVGGTWWASRSTFPRTALDGEDQPSLVYRAIETDVMDVRTGDHFWGLHLDSVLPCSSMIVKGGGHLVTLSVPDDHDSRCIYQVVNEKKITLQGDVFRLRVIGTDQIHVEREPTSDAVVTNR